MSRDLKKELRTLREKLKTFFDETKIIDKRFTDLFLSMVWLYALLDQEGKTKNLKERRRIVHELKRRKKDLQKRIRDVYEQANQRTNKEPILFSRGSMSRVWRNNRSAGIL